MWELRPLHGARLSILSSPPSGRSRPLSPSWTAPNAVTGGHGLFAGCSFPEHLLKAFLAPSGSCSRRAVFRDYVDDVTLLAMTRVKAALKADNMVRNGAKQQMYGPTKAARDPWPAIGGTRT